MGRNFMITLISSKKLGGYKIIRHTVQSSWMTFEGICLEASWQLTSKIQNGLVQNQNICFIPVIFFGKFKT